MLDKQVTSGMPSDVAYQELIWMGKKMGGASISAMLVAIQASRQK
jgi:hypothetical protein